MRFTDSLTVLQNGFFDGVAAGLNDLGVAERVALLNHPFDGKILRPKCGEDIFNEPLPFNGIRRGVIKHVIEATEERSIPRQRENPRQFNPLAA